MAHSQAQKFWQSPTQQFVSCTISACFDPMSKPSIPYVEGATFEVRRHEPPQPTRGSSCIANPTDMKEQQRMSLLERCFLHPPLPGPATPAGSDSEYESVPSSSLSLLRILKPISVHDNQAAQIILCGSGGDMIAKFYDPLYAATPTRENDIFADPFRTADYSYAHETAAYEALTRFAARHPHISCFFPRYYGSYTCEISTPLAGKTRTVRLILMEYIEGTCLSKVDPTQIPPLPQDGRKCIMASIVNAESALSAGGLNHRDLFPRNIILRGYLGGRAGLAAVTTGELKRSSDFSVVVLDFGRSDILHGKRCADDQGRPISPILRWDRRTEIHIDWQLLGWVDWDWQAWLEQQWKNSTTYAPITEELRKTWLGVYDRQFTVPPPVPLRKNKETDGLEVPVMLKSRSKILR
ncbi:hypothetical protein EPUS_04616 [Endocarpon pusillum Z07020]|uniref:Protein kinase domain-containing protein n=1 Tax=Endocarpon pusillum (strain Z07020 / HMAS-L-300199) TaxID=1263415 RepID=U1GUE2_ENDPU|nr:uncharacterized protein EPUS_04616 [Endocarpon pusillum Z07020]ERF75636.1 hypothetical protein EPUS_04616 [Endocarpon pusillum Z07020]